MASRSELREKIMTIIYQITLYKNNKMSYNVEDVIKENVEIDNEFVKDMVYGIITNFDELTNIANEYLKDWTIDRLNKVDQAILELGIFELMYTTTPSIVSINEAIELSKKYSEEAVTKMINGVLDKIYHEETKESE